MNVPFLDLSRQYEPLNREIDYTLRTSIRSYNYILGPNVKNFEDAFAEYCGANYAIGVSSGTAALFLALKTIGIKKHDEVIIPADTYIATALAISHAGAKPVLVDIDENTYNIDVKKIQESINNNTKAIIGVHLYGRPANIEGITEIARNNRINLIWDACQAHGAEYHGRNVGSFDHINCFSFYPTKNLGCFGDGGMILTNNKKFADIASKLRDYGRKDRYSNDMIGYNSRLDEIQASCLELFLNHLDGWNKKRIKKAAIYKELLSGVEQVMTPIIEAEERHVYHLYVIMVRRRDNLKDYLKKKGIETLIHYPIPIHLQKAYAKDGYYKINLGYRKGDFPLTEKLADEALSLPMFPELREDEIEYVAESIKEFYSKIHQ